MRNKAKKEGHPCRGDLKAPTNNALSSISTQERGALSRPPISHDQLKRRYAALLQSEEDYQKRLAKDAFERMTPLDKQRLAVQRIKLYEFLDVMEEIFGDKLPILIPTAIFEGKRIPMVKWKSLTENIKGEERTLWMQKLEQAVCGGGCVRIRWEQAVTIFVRWMLTMMTLWNRCCRQTPSCRPPCKHAAAKGGYLVLRAGRVSSKKEAHPVRWEGYRIPDAEQPLHVLRHPLHNWPAL